MKSKAQRTFSSLVRMPYQDAIAVTLHVHDFHLEMAHKEQQDKEFHIRQALRLKSWLTEMKDYIQDKEWKIERE